jgi:hypothetical protein
MPPDRIPGVSPPLDRVIGTSWWRRRILWLLPAVHLLVWGLYAALRRPVGDFTVETDFFGDYVPWSRVWMQGHPSVMSGFKGPVYYLLLGIPSRILSWIAAGGRYPPGLEFAAGKALSVIAAALAVYLVGWIALRLCAGSARPGATAAACAVLVQVVLASDLDFIDHSYRASTDLPALALMLGTLAAALGARTRRGFLIAGVLAALACLTRYNAVALLPALLLIAFRAPESAGGRWKGAAAAAAGFVLASLPWWLFCLARTGNPLYNRNALNAAFEVFGRDIPLDRFMAAGLPFDSWADLFRADTPLVLRTWASNVPRNLHYDASRLLGWPVAALCLLGWLVALTRIGGRVAGGRERGVDPARPPETARGTWALLAFAWLLVFLSNIPIFYGSRFSLPGLPFYALGFAGFAPWIDRAGARRAGAAEGTAGLARWIPRAALWLAGAALAAGITRGLVLGSREDRFYQPREVLEMRRDLRRRGIALEPDAFVASRKPHGAYWLGLRPAAVPDGDTIERIVENLRLEGIRYLYVGSSTMIQRPVLEPLANPSRLSEEFPGLRRLAAGFHRMGNRVIPGVLYEVEGARTPVGPAGAGAGTSAAGRAGTSGGATEAVRPVTPAGVPRAAYVRFALGRLYLTHFLLGAARPLLDSAAAAAPRWAPALEWAGDAALFMRDLPAAATRYVAANQLAPDSASTWCRLAACSLGENRVEEAKRNLTRALGYLPPDLARGTLAEVGERYFEVGEYGAAVAPLFFACLEKPSDRESVRRLATIPWGGSYPILGTVEP